MTKNDPRVIETPSGAIIYVGRNAQQNDALVSKYCNTCNTWWFHAGDDTPGAHVILIPLDGTLQNSDVSIASLLALKHSQAENKHRGRVTYCKSTNVIKPHGYKPGQVSFKDRPNTRSI